MGRPRKYPIEEPQENAAEFDSGVESMLLTMKVSAARGGENRTHEFTIGGLKGKSNAEVADAVGERIRAALSNYSSAEKRRQDAVIQALQAEIQKLRTLVAEKPAGIFGARKKATKAPPPPPSDPRILPPVAE